MKYYLSVFSKFAQFSGRARRSEYWFFALFNVIAAMACALIDFSLGTFLLYPIYVLVSIIPGIAVAVRRMHDVNKSGWYILIPLYNLILALSEGTSGSNNYGQDPKGEQYNFEFEQKAA